MPYSVRRMTCVRPSLSVAIGGKGAARRVDEGGGRAGRTVLAYVRGGAGVAAVDPSSRPSGCQSRPPGASVDDQKPVVSCNLGVSMVIDRVVVRVGNR